MSAVELADNTLSVDAALIAQDLGLEPERVLDAMRDGRVTALCEQGIEKDAGRLRVTFYHAHRRLRLVVDESGRVVERIAGRLRARRPRKAPPGAAGPARTE